jgi:hypothetical protein
MIDLIERCSVWKNDNKFRLCQTEYVVLFIKDTQSVISGFRGDVNEICALLGYYAASNV